MEKLRNEEGFSYIDVMCGIIILMFGIMAVSGAITAALMRSTELDQRLKAKQISSSAMESIISARDINRSGGIAGWDSVQNAPAGLFLTGYQSVKDSAGPDGVWGTADDSGDVVKGFQRQIEIQDIEDPDRPSSVYGVKMRKIIVSVQYQGTGAWRTETVTTILSDYKPEE